MPGYTGAANGFVRGGLVIYIDPYADTHPVNGVTFAAYFRYQTCYFPVVDIDVIGPA